MIEKLMQKLGVKETQTFNIEGYGTNQFMFKNGTLFQCSVFGNIPEYYILGQLVSGVIAHVNVANGKQESKLFNASDARKLSQEKYKSKKDVAIEKSISNTLKDAQNCANGGGTFAYIRIESYEKVRVVDGKLEIEKRKPTVEVLAKLEELGFKICIKEFHAPFDTVPAQKEYFVYWGD